MMASQWRPTPSDPTTESEAPYAALQPKGKCKESADILGIVALHYIDMLDLQLCTVRGWIECTDRGAEALRPT